MRSATLAVRAALFVLAVSALALAVSADELDTYLPGLGSIHGTFSPNGRVRVFRGIPYATAERFGVTTTPKPWGQLNTTVDGAACPQVCDQPPHTCADKFAESCLFLNVFTPRREQIEEIREITGRNYLPIVIFFHGGNYKFGSGNGELYNAEYLAEKHGAVFVGVNYRLGALGFLASTRLGLEGNYALYDSASAVAFMQVFGPAFGGDIERITLMGQSAGSVTVPNMLSYAYDAYYYQTILPAYQHLRPCVSEEVEAEAAAVARTCDINKGNRRRQNRIQMRENYLESVTANHLKKVDRISSAGGLAPPMHLSAKASAISAGIDGSYVPSFTPNFEVGSCEAKRHDVYMDKINRCGDNLFFHGGYLLSNPFALPLRTEAEFDKITDTFMGWIGCNQTTVADAQLACARKVSSDVIMSAQAKIYASSDLNKRPLTQFMPISPMLEGDMLPIHPYKTLLKGVIIEDIPLVMGTTYDEGTLFIYGGFEKELDSTGYYLLVGTVFGFDKAETLLKWYPVDKSVKDQRPVLSTLTSDIIFHCANRNVSRLFASRQDKRPTQRAWLYLFDTVATFMKETWPGAPYCWERSCHGADLPFWHHVGWPKYFTPTTDEAYLSAQMVNYLANYANNFDPANATGVYVGKNAASRNLHHRLASLPDWPVYNPSTSVNMKFKPAASGPQSAFRDEYCNFIDGYVGYSFADPK